MSPFPHLMEKLSLCWLTGRRPGWPWFLILCHELEDRVSYHGTEEKSVMNIYVGNLAYSVLEEDLQGLFDAYGEVASVRIIMDKITRKSRGFGFVEMPTDTDAQKAIAELNGRELKGSDILVNQARERSENRSERRPRDRG